MREEAAVLDEISMFIAGMNPAKVVAFKPSPRHQQRLDTLLDRSRDIALSADEKNELEHYLIINRLVGLAKARAISMLQA